jgi:retron-type reverse transcriptase
VSITVPQQVMLRELFDAWRKARRGKVPSRNQLAFDSTWTSGLLQLQAELNGRRWKPRASTCFVATRPKAREIHAPDFCDRVVHHWLVPQLEALWEPRFIHHSYANRRGKGNHAAVRMLERFVREVHSGQGGGWFLQLDIRNFFNTLDRRILLATLEPTLRQLRFPARAAATALLQTPPLSAGVHQRFTAAEIAQVPEHKRLANATPGCGLPIGNLSSQFFANVYLDALDQFAKHTLRARRYLRYVDDFVLVHHDRTQLAAWLDQIRAFLRDTLHLELKADIRLRPLTDGIDFLGYVARPTHTVIRRRVVSHARAKLASWEQAHVHGDRIRATPAELRELCSITTSYAGHFRHGRTYRLQRSIEQRFAWLPTATRPRRFHHSAEWRSISIRLSSKHPTNKR